MLQAGPSWSPSNPQEDSRHFQLSDLSRRPRERAIRTWPLLLLLPVIAAPGSGRRSRLQDKEGAEPIFWSLLGTELLCFYSSCRPYILPGDSGWNTSKLTSSHFPSPWRRGYLHFLCSDFPISGWGLPYGPH